jgi:hypothetical protein
LIIASPSDLDPTPTSALLINLPTETSTRPPSATPAAENTPRATATRQSKVIATAKPATVLTITPTLLPTETAVPQTQVRVIIRTANLRAGPGEDQLVVGFAREDEILTVIEVNENETWLLVQTADGLEGWIGSTIVEPVNGETD